MVKKKSTVKKSDKKQKLAKTQIAQKQDAKKDQEVSIGKVSPPKIQSAGPSMTSVKFKKSDKKRTVSPQTDKPTSVEQGEGLEKAEDNKLAVQTSPSAPEKLPDSATTVITMPSVEEIEAENKKQAVAGYKKQDDPATIQNHDQLAKDGPTVISGQPLARSSAARTSGMAKQPPLPPSVVKLKKRHTIKKVAAGFVLVLILVTAGTWLYLKAPADVAAENSELVRSVSQIVLLPSDETPAVTTVVDETRVNQEFLKGTKKGDKVLLYFQAGKAVVFRPATGQIINMGPLETPKPQVFIRNGSIEANAAKVVQTLSGSAEFTVASLDESPKRNYEKTVVVDVSGVRPDVAKRLADYLGVDTAELPEGESRPEADVLVIVGNDQKSQ